MFVYNKLYSGIPHSFRDFFDIAVHQAVGDGGVGAVDEAVVDAVIPAAGRIDPGFLDVQETFVNGVDERECIGCGVDGPAVEQGTAPDGESGGGNGRRLARQQFLPFFPENPGDKPIDGGHSTRE